MKKQLVAVLAVLLLADVSFGAGFALYEYSGRSTAMGGAVMANDAEPASLAANPSLITELEGTQIQIGATAVQAHAKTTIENPITHQQESRTLKKDTWVLPNFYITHKWDDKISFGLGGFSRFGLGGHYKNDSTWIGSMLAYKVKLETFSFTPTLAIKANDELSLAMGLEAMTIDFTQNSMMINNTMKIDPANSYEIHGTGISWGGNFSLTYRPEWAEKWSFGALYRSKVKQNLDGYIHTQGGGVIINPLTGKEVVRNSAASGAINLPDSLATGIAFRPTEDWVLEAGITGTFWSSYDQIIIEYTEGDELAPTIHNKKRYKDTYRLNFGTEYKLNQNWAVRAGYVYDKSPINHHSMDTLVPVDDRHLVSAGFGYKTDTWSADFAYTHIFGKDLKGTASNQYYNTSMKYSEGRSDMIALTIGYKF